MNGKIYIIKNTINNKVYIGQTIQTIKRRFQKHLTDYEAKKDDKNTNKLIRAIKKYGKEKFFVELIEENIPTKEELDKREIYWIKYYDSYKNGYNSTLGGQHTNQPSKWNRDEIKKLWDEGLSEKQIVQKINIPIDTLCDIIRHEFLISKEEVLNRRIKQQYLYSDIDLLYFWNEEKLGIFQIHKKYGGNCQTIKRRLINLKIPIEEIEERSKENRGVNLKNKSYNIQEVYQYDLKGNFIKSYKSIKEASEATNTERTSISKVLHGEYKTANGFIWSKEKLKQNDIILNNSYKKVYQFDDDYNLINIYESIASAARKMNYKSPSTLSAACKNNKKARGYYWSFNMNIK